ncbi:sensor histidine kinase [Streptomyces nojiriensis]|uniref:histidine kinase n=1 Tax=Streptomyces nojiriensis TaxID=66374 RepID=A0ABQ3SYX9_9ACTN|nr:histidine kinase [Streptomyces nojiriensis]QTI46853.1 Sensor histidine kinase DesK [Streptomyces nojiriensis]GGS18049.1 two-component sensor histidine kinase [Streptomyces nojiriensis]GHI73341.1 two-component sensor histidine kinase [Streptomyces nojiriensis]
MTETTTGGTSRAPEFRLASEVIATLRRDLVTDALAYRPLPLAETSGRFVRRLPGVLRRYAPWRRHAAVGILSVLVGLTALNTQLGAWGNLRPIAMAVISAAPVLMTLVRPVGAWWAAIAMTVVTAGLGDGYGYGYNWPWTDSSFFAYIAVMFLVTLRTGARVAAWMWTLTLVLGSAISVVFSGHWGSNLPEMAVASAFALVIASSIRIRLDARAEVSAQQEVTAVERDKRTLLEERTTIARELHDVVAHHMSVVAIQAEAAPYRVKNPPPELEAAFVTIRENAVAALTELRRVLGVVRSADYEAPDAPQPTLASLEGLLANVRDAGLIVEKTITGSVRELPQGVELSAYRIIQEALSNTLRHAPGATAEVEVSYVLGGLGIRIVNDRATGDARPSPGAGHGITGMRERVAMLEGEMTAGRTPAGGYEVAVFIPVAHRAESAPEPREGTV